MNHANSMTHSFHLAALLPSPKRDAGLRARELRGMRLPALRNTFGTTTID